MLKKFFNIASDYVTDKGNMVNVENRFLLSFIILASSLSFLAAIANTVFGLHPNLTIISVICHIGFDIIFLLARYKKMYRLAKWALGILCFMYLNANWLYNNGSLGPTLLIFVGFLFLIMLLFDKESRTIMLIIFISNAFVLYYLELNYPNVVEPYASEQQRINDIYWTFIVMISIAASIIVFSRKISVIEQQKIVESEQRKSVFLEQISFELKTPLNAILGYSELLKSEEHQEKKEKYDQIINKNSEHLIQLVDNIIAISRIETNQVKSESIEFSVIQLLEELHLYFSSVMSDLSKDHIRFVLEMPKGIDLKINSDRTHIKHVLSILISNAIKFTDYGEISFGCAFGKEQIKFFVHDTGLGISPEHHELVFEKFTKIDPREDGKTLGTGLGLSIAKSLVQIMGGDILVNSNQHKGTEISFNLPLGNAQIDTIGSYDPTDFQLNLDLLNGKKILIIEDNEDQYRLVHHMLQEIDIQTKWMHESLESKDRSVLIPDVILLNVSSKKDETEAKLSRIKKLFPKIPVVALSAFTQPHDENFYKKMGFDHFIPKPIIQLQLYKVIQLLIASREV